LVCVRSQLHGGLGWRSPLWLVRRLACAAGCWFGAGHHLGAVSDPVTTLTHYGSSHFEHSAVVLGSVEAPALGVMWVGLPSTASQRVTPSCGTAETCSSCPSTFTWSMLLAVAPLAHDGVSGLEICAQWCQSITLVVSHWSCCVGGRVGGKVSVVCTLRGCCRARRAAAAAAHRCCGRSRGWGVSVQQLPQFMGLLFV
jgi:hypothetical protein